MTHQMRQQCHSLKSTWSLDHLVSAREHGRPQVSMPSALPVLRLNHHLVLCRRSRPRQDFARMGSEKVYGIQPEQVVGTASGTKYDKDGRPILIKEPKLMLFDGFGGKAEGIHLMIGRRPYAAFGSSTRDQQMLEYTGAGDGARLMMLVLHDDAVSDLPIEFPTKLELIINVRTAKTLGLEISPTLLARADEVIE